MAKETDCGFPILEYSNKLSYKENGHRHGEEFRTAISELVEIRRDLMLKKNPSIKSRLEHLGMEQFQVSKQFSPHLTDELEGIAEGANETLLDLVILNNYTDFRDLQLPEEGCSTIYSKTSDNAISGQTWDMHSSAKKYVSVINVPPREDTPGMVLFSLVGCLGMMGFNTHGLFLGVNNINTLNAKKGLIWPLLVRKLLENQDFDHMRTELTKAPVTSGHNYILGSKSAGEHWEVMPEMSQLVSGLGKSTTGEIFHTNHCLHPEIQKREDKSSVSSTTFDRYKILEEKSSICSSLEGMKSLLTDHTNYPKSICSHFESGVQDPSMTCGGGVVDHTSFETKLWRGCSTYDDNFVEYSFKLAHDKSNIPYFQQV
jgi:isopenicillin-N N-acyltransferase like protein